MHKLSDDTVNHILSFLPKDKNLLSVGLLNQRYYAIYKKFMGYKPYSTVILEELHNLGYLPLKSLVLNNLYLGINKEGDAERKLASVLSRHKEMKSGSKLSYQSFKLQYYIITEDCWKLMREHCDMYGNILGIPSDEMEALKYLQDIYENFDGAKINSPCDPESKPKLIVSKAEIINPIYLRIYLELLIFNTFDPERRNDNNYYKKMILISSILVKATADEPLGHFCLMEIIKEKVLNQQNQEMIKLIDHILKQDPRVKTIANESTFVDYVVSVLEKFAINISKFKKMREFIRKFDFFNLFFYPRSSIRYLRDIANASEIKFEDFLQLPAKLYTLFSSDSKLRVYKKIFKEKFQENFQLISEKAKTEMNGMDSVLTRLIAIAKNEVMFKKLSVQEIFSLPNDVEFLISGNAARDGLSANWNFESICEVQPLLDDFMKIYECEKHWIPEEIFKLLAAENRKIFQILSNCEHRELLFATFKTLQDLHSLYEGNLLGLLCRNRSRELCRILLVSCKDPTSLRRLVCENNLVQKMLYIENVDLLLRNYPQYRSVNNNFPQTALLENLDMLARIAKNPFVFECITQLYNNNISQMEQDMDIIDILLNPIILHYLNKQQITMSQFKSPNYFPLFKFLSASLKSYHNHISLLSLPHLFKLYHANLLEDLLSYDAALFNWILLEDTGEGVPDEKTKCREYETVQYILQSGIPKSLTAFGFTDETGKFVSCIEEILKFKLDFIKSLHLCLIFPKETLLQRICCNNPVLLLCANSQHKLGEEKAPPYTLEDLKDFYTKPYFAHMTISPHAWLAILYLEKIIPYLMQIKNNTCSALEFLLSMNKKLFEALIKLTATDSKKILLDRDFVHQQKIPSYYKIDTEKFKKLFHMLYSTSLLAKPSICIVLLGYLQFNEIVELGNVIVDPVKNLNAFQLLAYFISRHDPNKFFSTYPTVENICKKTMEFYESKKDILTENKNTTVLLSRSWQKEGIGSGKNKDERTSKGKQVKRKELDFKEEVNEVNKKVEIEEQDETCSMLYLQ